MDSDVWKSKLSAFVSDENVNTCQMDLFESDFQYYSYSTLSELSNKNPTYMTLFVSAKNKVPI
jgi:hypothetical protein